MVHLNEAHCGQTTVQLARLVLFASNLVAAALYVTVLISSGGCADNNHSAGPVLAIVASTGTKLVPKAQSCTGEGLKLQGYSATIVDSQSGQIKLGGMMGDVIYGYDCPCWTKGMFLFVMLVLMAVLSGLMTISTGAAAFCYDRTAHNHHDRGTHGTGSCASGGVEVACDGPGCCMWFLYGIYIILYVISGMLAVFFMTALTLQPGYYVLIFALLFSLLAILSEGVIYFIRLSWYYRDPNNAHHFTEDHFRRHGPAPASEKAVGGGAGD